MTAGASVLWLLLAGAGAPHRLSLPHEVEAPPGLAAASVRPTSASSPDPRYLPTDVVESVVSPGGRFRVHFTRQGVNAVPLEDADGDGVPDIVARVGATYERVATFYAGLGFRLPPDDSNPEGDDGGDGLFDVYLLDFGMRGDGAFRQERCLDGVTRCAGVMLQENDFAGYGYPSEAEAVDTLASHEFFHAVQAAYRPGLGAVASEGTAVWATERFEPALDDLEGFTRRYLSSPELSLLTDPAGPASGFSYGAGLFFQSLSERHGDGVLVALLEESVRQPTARWPLLLDTCLRRDFASSFDEAFTRFATWNLGTASRATPGFGYAGAEGYAPVTTTDAGLPTQVASLRVAGAASRLFEVPGDAPLVAATFVPEPGTDTTALHLVLAAVTDDAVLRVTRVDGPAALSARVEAHDATRVVVAVVDGRAEGLGRYGALCIAATGQDAPCAPVTEVPDAGTPDAGTDAGFDAGGPDAGTVDAGSPQKPGNPPDGGCQASGGSLSGVLGALLLALGLKGRRRARVG
jgi:hypothetical protein